MMLRKWESLPDTLKTPEVAVYYEILSKKKGTLFVKRMFDIVVSALMLLFLSPLYLIIAIAIKTTSRGPVFFRQRRITRYCRPFRIFKFRTMVVNAESVGAQVTSKNDSRITRVGALIRKCRLDEIAQLIDILRGTMTFVGTRPEVPKYVEKYTPEMMATLLLPAGVTSLASIMYKDEDRLLEGAEDVEEVYVNEVLPGKMKYNLMAIKQLSLKNDIAIMFKTVAAVISKGDSENRAAAAPAPETEAARLEKVH